MVYTRSAVIFAVAVVLMGFFSVGKLWFFETAGSTTAVRATPVVAGGPSSFSGDVVEESAGLAENKDLDALRAEVWSRLDGALALGDTDLALESSDNLQNDRRLLVESDANEPESLSVHWCDATVLDTQFSATWPTGNVSVVEREGARLILFEPTMANGTSSAASAPQALMQYPLRPPLRAEPGCLIHGYIGVTPDGALIHNNDMHFLGVNMVDELVGYAFDGNPIYSMPTHGELDECGGLLLPEGYRYVLSSEREFILGCFMSEPQQTLLVG